MARVALYLVSPVYFWFTVLPAALVPLVLFQVFNGAEVGFRTAGAVLEVLGVMSVVLGILQNLERFGRPSVLAQLRAYLFRFPRFRRSVVAVVGGASSVESAGHITVSMGAFIRGPETMKERIERLEREIKEVRAKVHTLRSDMHAADEKLQVGIDSERTERSRADESLRRSIEDLGIGDSHLEAIGVFWIVFGLLLATFSQEIAAAFA